MRGSAGSWPSIPLPDTTTREVFARTWVAALTLRVSTHTWSYRRRCSHEMALRPLTWARPVIPGRTANRSDTPRPTLALSDGSIGRGPTRLISPAITLNNCGSSSSDVRRRKRPIGVIRESSGTIGFGPESIVRNLNIAKGRRPLPMRCWVKKMGRPEVMRTASATSPIAVSHRGALSAMRTRSNRRSCR